MSGYTLNRIHRKWLMLEKAGELCPLVGDRWFTSPLGDAFCASGEYDGIDLPELRAEKLLVQGNRDLFFELAERAAHVRHHILHARTPHPDEFYMLTWARSICMSLDARSAALDAMS